MAAALLDIDGLAVSFHTRVGRVDAVTDFSLQLGRGDCVGLVGESGCGKSTVAMAIMGYLAGRPEITAERMAFAGTDLLKLDARGWQQLRGGAIAMIYQEPMAALNPVLTAGRQLMEVPQYHRGLSAEAAYRDALDMLATVRLPEPERIAASFPHQLSGGQQQRVVIAMALLAEPSLLLLDEPTTALDVTVEAGIVELIRQIREDTGTAMLFISHNLGLVREVCDRVQIMYAGETVEEGPIADVFASMRHPYTRGLFGCLPSPMTDKHARPLRPIPGTLPSATNRPDGCLFAPRCAFAQAGRCDAGKVPLERVPPAESGGQPAAVRCLRWQEIPRDATVGEPVGAAAEPGHETTLSVQDLKKHYPIEDRSLTGALLGRTKAWVRANDGVNLDARARETVAVVGESGCGKSTLAKVLLGLETATSGRVTVLGREMADRPVTKRRQEERAALQMVFQNPSDTLNPARRVGHQIARVMHKLLGRRGDGAGQSVRQQVESLLDMVRLSGSFYERLPRQLSGGQKQRVAVARAFAGQPKLVVADEPVSALDVSVAASVTGLLLDVQKRYDTTLLFISHDLAVVRYLADRIVVMYAGEVMEQGPTRAVFDPPYHPYTEALLAAVPVADPRVQKRRLVLSGTPPSGTRPAQGCPFADRCPRKLGAICDEHAPPVREPQPGHRIACHIAEEDLRAVPPVFSYKDMPEAAE